MARDRLDFLRLDETGLRHKLPNKLSEVEREAIHWNWPLWARRAQLAPPADWRVWLVMAGRGFGNPACATGAQLHLALDRSVRMARW
jgi:phage terminase large subunit-like protein